MNHGRHGCMGAYSTMNAVGRSRETSVRRLSCRRCTARRRGSAIKGSSTSACADELRTKSPGVPIVGGGPPNPGDPGAAGFRLADIPTDVAKERLDPLKLRWKPGASAWLFWRQWYPGELEWQEDGGPLTPQGDYGVKSCMRDEARRACITTRQSAGVMQQVRRSRPL